MKAPDADEPVWFRPSIRTQDVNSFFSEFAESYDEDVQGPYWEFSHRVLARLIDHFLSQHFGSRRIETVLDAGCGTGVWATRIAQRVEPRAVTLVDRNSSMLDVAARKAWGSSAERTIIEADLEAVSLGCSFDLIICFHNVIGFANSSERVIRNLRRHLKSDGLALLMAPNLANAVRIGTTRTGPAENWLVRYRNDMPWMSAYTPEAFRTMLSACEMYPKGVFGFPVRVAPHTWDAQVFKLTEADPVGRARPSELFVKEEAAHCLDQERAVYAGSSLLSVCTRRPLP